MITSKQRAYLRGLANSIKPIFQIGKDGLSDMQMEKMNEALKKRELIKVHILETAMLDAKETCGLIAEKIHAEPVAAIGHNFVLYKKNPQEPQIILPGTKAKPPVKKLAAPASKKKHVKNKRS